MILMLREREAVKLVEDTKDLLVDLCLYSEVPCLIAVPKPAH
jgi:hypothetical protein